MKKLLEICELKDEEIYYLINRALELKKNNNLLKKRNDIYIANLFFENSTRTKHSFEIAEKSINLNVIDFEVSTSSVNKGESLYDTCKTLEMIGCNMLVIRHSKNKYYKELESINIPIINAGDGSGEHPSQCLLDLMTIYEVFGKINGLNIVIVGDIKNSRVARSNYNILTRLGANVKFVSPECFDSDFGGEKVDFDQIIDKVDVCMLLRIQFERHKEKILFNNNDYNKKYGLTKERYKKLKENSIIMHPAPVNRGVEIDDELVESEKSVIFQQMANGRYMREAILEKIIIDNNI